MTWTYNQDPAFSNLDQVRFLCGQVSTSDDILLTDEELQHLISDKPSVEHAAAAACDVLANRYAQSFPSAEAYGKTRLDWSKRVSELRRAGKALLRQAVQEGVAPFVGGRSKSDINTRNADTDRVRPAFEIGMTDYPGSVASRSSST